MSDGTGSALTWAGLITAVTALAGTFLPYLKRKDERTDRVQDDRDKMRLNMDKRQNDELDRLYARISLLEKQEAETEAAARLRRAEHEAEIGSLERDRDRGWELARLWRRLAARLSHRLANKITALNGLISNGIISMPLFEPEKSFPELEKITQQDVEP